MDAHLCSERPFCQPVSKATVTIQEKGLRKAQAHAREPREGLWKQGWSLESPRAGGGAAKIFRSFARLGVEVNNVNVFDCCRGMVRPRLSPISARSPRPLIAVHLDGHDSDGNRDGEQQKLGIVHSPSPSGRVSVGGGNPWGEALPRGWGHAEGDANFWVAIPDMPSRWVF